MDTPPDTLTVALDDYLIAHCALLQALAGDNPTFTALTQAVDTKWRVFVERLNERSTSMAASAAVGVIRKYTEALSAIEERVTDLETHDKRATAAGIDDQALALTLVDERLITVEDTAREAQKALAVITARLDKAGL